MTTRLFEPLRLDVTATRPLLPFRGAGWALFASVGGALASTALREAARMPPWEFPVLVALGVAIAASAWMWRSRRRSAIAVYWVAQMIAASVITVASRGYASLVLLPILAQTVVIAPRRFAMASGAFAIFVATAATRLRTPSWLAALSISAGHIAGVCFVLAFMVLLLREQEARVESHGLLVKLEAANQRLREFTKQAEQLATERERARIAREVHDILGHSLTAAHAQLTGALAVRKSDPSREVALIESARTLTEQGLADVRRSVAALRVGGLTGPLATELHKLLTTTESMGLRADLVIDGDAFEPSATVALVVYRVVQECVTNCVRHGRASYLHVSLHYDRSELDLRVEDDGVGAVAIELGVGLQGIVERVALLGGEVVIDTSRGQGLRLSARVPLGST